MIRKITLFLAVGAILSAHMAVGQDELTSFGMAPQNDFQKSQSDVLNLKNPSSQAWCYNGSPNFQLNSQLLGNTTLTPVGATTTFGFPGAMAWVPSTHTLYVIDQVTPFGLYTLDTLTGLKTLVVNCTGVPYANFTGLTWDGTTMWGVASDITSSQIFTVNIVSGVCTTVGSPSTSCAAAIMLNSFPGIGNLFSVDIIGDNLYKWDKTTGVPTLVGALGFDANFGQDGNFDLSDGAYYWAAYNSTTAASELRILDTTNGTSTLVASYASHVATLGITEMEPMVSISEINASFEASVYPNPGMGEFHISTGRIADEILITDISGRQVLAFIPETAQVRIDLSEQEDGMYFVRVLSGDKVTNLRLVLSR